MDQIPDRADALEAADNGRRQELAMWNEIVALGCLPELKALDPELARLASLDAAGIREKAIDSMKIADANRNQRGASELHLLFGEIATKVDEIADVLRREVGE